MATDDGVLTIALEATDGTTGSFDVPTTLIDRLSEGDEPAARVVADVAVMAFTGRAHALVHHARGEVGPELEDAEEMMLDAFEDRFGVSYAEATGHEH